MALGLFQKETPVNKQLNLDSDRVLIHAVQNPVGCIAVQLIKAWGGHVNSYSRFFSKFCPSPPRNQKPH